MYPFDAGDISAFFVQKNIGEKTFSAQPRFPRPQYSPDNGQNLRLDKSRKGKAHVKNTPGLQRERILQCINVKMSKAGPFFKMDKKQFCFSSVPKHRGSQIALRSKAADFEPFIPRRKKVCNDSMLITSERDIENKNMQVYSDQPVDLKQSYKELTDEEEKFLADLVFN